MIRAHKFRRAAAMTSAALAAALVLSACGSGAAETPKAEETPEAPTVLTVTDMTGATVEIPADPKSIVATDNHVFRTLDNWGVELTAAPKQIMTEIGVSYTENESVIDIGNHREPNFETFVEAQPDLVLNGGRFRGHKEEVLSYLPEEAAVVDTSFDLEQTAIDTALRDLTELLGNVFQREDDAQKLIADFDKSIDSAKKAYNSEETVAGIITSGGELNYSAPTTGRAIGPVFDLLGLTPALDKEGSTDHQGDSISVEAIAAANPDWLIVMDRDAGTSAAREPGFHTAKELLEESEALQNVTAVQKGQIVYLEPAFYTTEDIQAYTKLFNDLAKAFG